MIEVGGGGSFIVLPLDDTGRIGHHVSKVGVHDMFQSKVFNNEMLGNA